ncbi:MAG: NUDIX domain-containing protein [Candidatus Moranbacteria bacterium]|nr:NUDIX domain-containing protein [Candidatus Moranbacteria bacterium]
MKPPVWKPLYFVLHVFGAPVSWEVSAGSVLFRIENGIRQYLVLRYRSGHFDFPKGHMEEGETPEETAQRETGEEVGIWKTRVLPIHKSIRFFYVAKGEEREDRKRNRRGIWIFKIVHFFPLFTEESAISVPKDSHENTSAEWLPYADARRKLTFENARLVLDMAEKSVDFEH